jgi:hypothetical protein
MTDIIIQPLINMSIVRVTQIADNLGSAVAGSSSWAIVKNTTIDNNDVIANPTLSPDS